jgi:hypothetical protein
MANAITLPLAASILAMKVVLARRP